LSGCASTDGQSFDLHAAQVGALSSRAVLSIDAPTAAPPLDGDLLVVRESGDRLSTLAGAQWAGRLTALVGDRTFQTFQNAGLGGRVRASGEAATYRLTLDIRRFDIDATTRQARVQIAANLVRDGGAIAAARIFDASEPVAEISGVEPPLALDRAFARVLPQIVAWAASGR
jgi:phospholipid/cholesterol/gamma-HCH transport system substrate-binding protein